MSMDSSIDDFRREVNGITHPVALFELFLGHIKAINFVKESSPEKGERLQELSQQREIIKARLPETLEEAERA